VNFIESLTFTWRGAHGDLARLGNIGRPGGGILALRGAIGGACA